MDLTPGAGLPGVGKKAGQGGGGGPPKKRKLETVTAGPDPDQARPIKAVKKRPAPPQARPALNGGVGASIPIPPTIPTVAAGPTTRSMLTAATNTIAQQAPTQQTHATMNDTPGQASTGSGMTQSQAQTLQSSNRTAQQAQPKGVPVDPSNTLPLIINPAPIPANVRRLKMVHLSDLSPNTFQGRISKREPVYKVAFGKLFDHNSGDIMFQRGGPVIAIIVPGEGQRASAEYHVMLCDVRSCMQCKYSRTSIFSSGIASLDSIDRYKGMPLIHRQDVKRTVMGVSTTSFAFKPHWTTDAAEAMMMPLSARLANGRFYEDGKVIVQQAQLCKGSDCPKCSEEGEKELPMVHRGNLIAIPAGSDEARRAGDNISFACRTHHQMGRESTEWHQGGPVMKLYLLEDGLSTDVMVCQYQACQDCNNRNPVPQRRPYTSFRHPFVHKKDCTETAGKEDLSFEPSRHEQLDRGVVCDVERRIVQCDLGNAPGANGVMSAVCVPDSCSVCSPTEEQTAARVAEDLADAAKKTASRGKAPVSQPEQGDASTGAANGLPNEPMQGGGPNGGQEANGPPRVTQPSGENATQSTDESQGRQTSDDRTQDQIIPSNTLTGPGGVIPSNGPAVPPGGPPTQPNGPAIPVNGPLPVAVPPPAAFRMCHIKHLKYTATGVDWGKWSHAGGAVVNDYFVPNISDSYPWGGATYRVDFPNGMQQDVMVCRRYKCKACRGRDADAIGQRTNARPFVHRREILLNPLTQARTFVPVGTREYENPDVNFPLTIVTATFPQAGAGGVSGITIQCETCTAGSCSKCDPAGTTQTVPAPVKGKKRRR